MEQNRSQRDFLRVATGASVLAFAALGFVLSSIRTQPEVAVHLSYWTPLAVLVGGAVGWLPWKIVHRPASQKGKLLALTCVIPLVGAIVALSTGSEEVRSGLLLGFAAVAFAFLFFGGIFWMVSRPQKTGLKRN